MAPPSIKDIQRGVIPIEIYGITIKIPIAKAQEMLARVIDESVQYSEGYSSLEDLHDLMDNFAQDNLVPDHLELVTMAVKEHFEGDE